MDIESLYLRITEAIRRAETLDDLRAPGVHSAYLEVSLLEERVAKLLPATDPEGALARRGAVRAALAARERPRAQKLVEQFLAEADAEDELRAELHRLLQQAEPSLAARYRYEVASAGMEAPAIQLINRNDSRKLSDPEESRDVSLDEISGWIRQGKEVKVVGSTGGADATSQVLTQVALDEGRLPSTGAPRGGLSLNRFILTPEEIVAIRKLLDEIAENFDSVENPEFLRQAPVWAQELPRRMRAVLAEFRLMEPDAAHLIISGFPVDDEEIGPTPAHWNRPGEKHSPALAYEILLVLASSLLGEPIGWRTQQAGRVVHDVMPVKGMEQEQIGIGSEMTLWWHTEDAFHPMRGDYLGMICLRNPDEVPTTFASLDNVKLSPQDWETLFEPHYTIKPDNSHQLVNAAPEDEDELQQVYRRIEQMNRHPDKIALLSGDPRSPYIRIDHYFMDPIEDNPRAQQALDALIKAVDEQIADMVLLPGDICFIDNFKAVHGRRAFKARYDGHDRWIKRLNITRDLRKSRAERAGAASRII